MTGGKRARPRPILAGGRARRLATGPERLQRVLQDAAVREAMAPEGAGRVRLPAKGAAPCRRQDSFSELSSRKLPEEDRQEISGAHSLASR